MRTSCNMCLGTTENLPVNFKIPISVVPIIKWKWGLVAWVDKKCLQEIRGCADARGAVHAPSTCWDPQGVIEAQIDAFLSFSVVQKMVCP